MAKKQIQSLDLSLWVTQKEFAKEQGVEIQAVQNWIRREQIKTFELPGNTTLVNRTTLNIKVGRGRPRKAKN